MRRPVLLLPLLLVPLGLPVLLSQEPAHQEEEHTVLQQAMEDLNSGFKRLRRTVRRGQAEESLRLLQLMQAAAVTAKGEIPPLVAQAPEGERKAALVGYRTQMCDLLEAFLDLERAVLTQDEEQARATLERIVAVRDAGHERYSPEEGD